MSQDTLCVHQGRNPLRHGGTVNPPIARTSTIIFKDTAHLLAAEKNWHSELYYGRHGTETTFAFEEAMAKLEGGHRSVATSCGTSALTTAIAAFVKEGDHILMVDSAYGPTRKFCDYFLKRFGVEVTYYDPLLKEDVADLFQDNTKVLYMESPGSFTFELQDVPALAKAANAKNITTILDNTWATPLYCKPFDMGVDVTVHAATKYITGHSDSMLGVITCNEKSYLKVKQNAALLGRHAAPDDINLGLRGLRTLPVRLKQHGATALKLCEFLDQQKDVARVLYPAWPSDPHYEVWQRTCTGATGLFGFVFAQHITRDQMLKFVDNLNLFGIGFSWGGFESLVLPADLNGLRSATKWQEGQVVRLHAGLEDPQDLINDLGQALKNIH